MILNKGVGILELIPKKQGKLGVDRCSIYARMGL